MKEQETVDYWLRSTWLALQKMYNDLASEYNSTMVMAFTLLSLDPKNGTPSTTLGPKMGIEPTSLSRTLKNLEDRSLIARKPNPKDGRGVLIHLTKEGLKMRDLSKINVLEFNNKLTNELGVDQLGNFLTTIQQINQIVKQKAIQKNES